jgi:hypothetical protein
MNGKLTAYAAVAISVFLLSPQFAHSKAIEDYKWIEVRSDNFVVHSLLSKRQTEKVARNLEMARAVIPESLRTLREEASGVMHVYLVKGPGQVSELGRDGNSWLMLSAREPWFVVGADTYAEYWALRAYASSLVAFADKRRETAWYHAGMYSYFETARLNDGKFRYGGQSTNQRQNPDVILPQLEILLSDQEFKDLSDSRNARLRGYSWLLVRYLTDTTADWEAFGGKLADYNGRIEEGETIREAFESVFGLTVDQLSKELADFSESCCGQYVAARDTLIPQFEPVTTKLSQEQISLKLGHVAAANGAGERARELFEIALGSDATRKEAQAGIDALEATARPAEAGN